MFHPVWRCLKRNRPVLALLIANSIAGSIAIARADSLFIGFNTLTPVQIYSTSGNYIQDLGPASAIAAIPEASDYFFIQPSATSNASTVAQYNLALAPEASFTISNLIDNGAAGPNGTLFLGAFDGTVYQVSSTGTVLNSWSTGFTHIGVAFDGTTVYTTEGDTGSNIDEWSITGAPTGQIATPLTGLYGLGFDPASGDLWAGSTDDVYELDLNGNLLSTLDLPGDSQTPDGAVHDSVAVGELLLMNASQVPEPAPVALFGVGGLLMLALAGRKRLKFLAGIAAALGGAAASMFGAVNVTLTPSPGSASVGTTVGWTATATDTGSPQATLTYQFSVGPSGGPLQVRKDFSSDDTFAWTASDQEGSYVVQVNVQSSSGASGTASQTYIVTSLVSGGEPVISPTAHPLVALYSAPACTAGRTIRVRFKGQGDTIWAATPFKTCNGTTSVNFYIAGMRPSTAYSMQQDVYNGPFDTVGPILSFTTGALPLSVTLTTAKVDVPAEVPNSTAYPIVLNGSSGLPFATDTLGRLVWYLPSFPQPNGGYLTRPVSGGTFLGITDQPGSVINNRRLLREWDLAGNVVRETNVAAVNAQLKAMGAEPILVFSHEAIRLSNGYTAVIGGVEQVADQGAGPVDVVSDMAIVLDANLRVIWYWDAFDHLNIKHPAVLRELCTRTSFGCTNPQNPAYTVANDWTHANSLAPAPDGNLIMSIRHLDWVVKLNYQNGTAQWHKGQPDNTIIWTLGQGGSFSLPGGSSSSTFDSRWFSHQHDATYAANGTLTLYDNGNTRISIYGGDSRGQDWRLDEKNLTATPVLSQDLGVQSMAVGSAALLENGNYEFYNGFLSTGSSSVEYTPSGSLVFRQTLQLPTGYRAFRMRSLY
ncbi:MAG: aryl-sulfate sulfotransferase [Acidobacteriaceae bacterium]|nr:aryl-sulfate sulfotransferase [Acidobacteriaceae bacterium]